MSLIKEKKTVKYPLFPHYLVFDMLTLPITFNIDREVSCSIGKIWSFNLWNLRIDCFNNVELGKGGRCPSLLMKYNWANTFGQQIKTLAIFETNQDFCKNVSRTLLLYNKFSVTFDKGNLGEKNIGDHKKHFVQHITFNNMYLLWWIEIL